MTFCAIVGWIILNICWSENRWEDEKRVDYLMIGGNFVIIITCILAGVLS